MDRRGRSIAGDTTIAWIAPAFREIYRTLKDNRFCISWNRADDFLGAWRKAGFQEWPDDGVDVDSDMSMCPQCCKETGNQ